MTSLASRPHAHALALALFATANLSAQSLTIASANSAGAPGNGHSTACQVSASGRFVAFESGATNLVAGDTNDFRDVFVRDRWTSQTTRVSVSSTGTQANGPCRLGGLSADGRFVAFSTVANTIVPGDTNGQEDVFVHDRQTGSTARVSVSSAGAESNGWSNFAGRVDLSADGRYVAFDSNASNLVAGDTNSLPDVFVRDTWTGTTTRESVTSLGVEGDSASVNPAITPDGRYVVFESSAFNLDPNIWPIQTQIYRRDRLLGITISVCESALNPGYSGNGGAWSADVSADGNRIAFLSVADNLVAGDGNFVADVFVRDVSSGSLTPVSVTPAGSVGNFATLAHLSISNDGRFVLFDSKATDLAPGIGGTGNQANFFRRDLQTNTTLLLSKTPAGVAGNQFQPSEYRSGLAADGRVCAFPCSATDLVAADGNGAFDIFVSVDGLEAFGAGTPGCLGAHVITGTSVPKIGNADFAILNEKSPASALGLCLVANAQDPAGSDPFAIGVALHVDPLSATEFLGLDAFASGLGIATCAAPIPANPLLAGSSWYAQAIWPWTTCSLPPFSLSSTPGLRITVAP